MKYATYCPEDNKLRLYVGRVPHPEYLALRKDGWTSTPKQDCDFVAVWTPGRRDTALSYSNGVIEDEDQDPQDRAADRAERFGDYRDKRTGEAVGHADRYESQPAAHGFQNAKKAERAAARHDRVGTCATDQWDKAEYWTRRTAGVISNALYKSRPDVRMGRIKTLESDLRKFTKSWDGWKETWNRWKKASEIEDPVKKHEIVLHMAGSSSIGAYDYKHPRPENVTNNHVKESGSSLYSLMTLAESGYGESITADEACALFLERHPSEPVESDWGAHYRLRLAYENQMLEAQGGRAAVVEMIPGGWLRGGRRMRDADEYRQIIKVNKSPVTGRVVSVLVRDNRPSSVNCWGNPWEDGVPKVLCHTVKTERLDADCYREPTCEELAIFNGKVAEEKKANKVEAIPLINPTDEDAQRLQDLWNAEIVKRNEAMKAKDGDRYIPEYVPAEVIRMSQEKYSAISKGSYTRVKTMELVRGGTEKKNPSWRYRDDQKEESEAQGPILCKVRSGDGNHYNARKVIIISDKPQKPLPAAMWDAPIENPPLVLEYA